MTQPRRFHLERTNDPTGMSGTGRVADGIRWADGSASLRWLGDRPSVVFWASMDDAEWVHTHGGQTGTQVVWDEPEEDPGPPCDTCGHTQEQHPKGGYCVGELPYGGACGCDDYEDSTTPGSDQ